MIEKPVPSEFTTAAPSPKLTSARVLRTVGIAATVDVVVDDVVIAKADLVVPGAVEPVWELAPVHIPTPQPTTV
jgi:hypothetical protein